MGLIKIRSNRELAVHTKTRTICRKCLQPDFSCYCQAIQKFDPKIRFVILIHPLESRKRIATGRMTYLCLENSLLIQGHEFTYSEQVNELLGDPTKQVVVLYPGRTSINLSTLCPIERINLFDDEKELIVLVIDGTWNTARKTMHLSQNLKTIPRICFSPPAPSRFRVRKQPAQECYSTIEAVHHTIELLGPSQGFDLRSGVHHNLISVFDQMVEQRLQFMKSAQIG